MPSYLSKIVRSISQINKQQGENNKLVSYQAILKYIEENYTLEGTRYKSYVKRALKKAIQDKTIIQVKRSFRLPQAAVKKQTRKPQAEVKQTKPQAKKARSVKVTTTRVKPKPVIKAVDTPTPAPKEAPKETPKEITKESETAKANGSKLGYLWQYVENGGKWKNYDQKASDTVEEVYQKYLGNKGDSDVRAVKSGQWEYMVDFMAMKQTNIQHENHNIRSIRRVPGSN